MAIKIIRHRVVAAVAGTVLSAAFGTGVGMSMAHADTTETTATVTASSPEDGLAECHSPYFTNDDKKPCRSTAWSSAAGRIPTVVTYDPITECHTASWTQEVPGMGGPTYGEGVTYACTLDEAGTYEIGYI